LFEGKARGGKIAQRTDVREHIFPDKATPPSGKLSLLAGMIKKKEDAGNNFSASS
jgi:hypothetical protein